MNYQTIITPATLADNLYKTNLLILDCRGHVLNDSEAYKNFVYQHIPNAHYCSSNGDDIASLISKLHSRSSPELEKIIAELQIIGFTPNTQIVIYEELNSSLTDTLWLKFRSIGIANVAVLQGGFSSWKENKLPTSNDNQPYKNVEQVAMYH